MRQKKNIRLLTVVTANRTTETGRIPSLIIFIVVTASPPLVFGMNQTAQMISLKIVLPKGLAELKVLA